MFKINVFSTRNLPFNMMFETSFLLEPNLSSSVSVWTLVYNLLLQSSACHQLNKVEKSFFFFTSLFFTLFL